MPLEEPVWWYAKPDDIRRHLLTPVSWLYGWLAERRFYRQQSYRSRLPVICVGNFTAGGAGKTPLSLAIARMLVERGQRPAFLTRGFGGKTRGPTWVAENEAHAARLYGDEPLLLAAIAPTMIARDRREGVIAIENDKRAFTAVVMDDGLQNPAIAKNLTIALIDGRRGIGNGEVIPAGPLRAPFDFQVGLADAIVVRDPPEDADAPNIGAILRNSFPGPVLEARVAASGDTSWIARQPLLAFAGIANPQRFYRLLERLGGELLDSQSFADHHPFTATEAARLLEQASAANAQLVTTEKDFARLKGNPALVELAQQTRTVPIEARVHQRDMPTLHALIDDAIQASTHRQRPPPPKA